MPEGPECLYYSKCLNKIFAGKALISIQFVAGRYCSPQAPPSGFDKVIFPIKVITIGVHGKFIYFELENKTFIWNTLGMSGQWSLYQNSDTRYVVKYENFIGSTDTIYYNDRRNFGTLHFNKTLKETQNKISKLGYDLLNKKYLEPGKIIFSRKKNKKKTLCEILIAQDNYAGIGNYLKAEILYHAKLSPHRLRETLTEKEIIQLDKLIIEVTMNSYLGKIALFNHYETTYPKLVYHKKLDPLSNKVIVENTKDGRKTFWVKEIQK